MENKTISPAGGRGMFDILDERIHAALETYSNVHRGSGYHSTVTDHLYEEARRIILDHMGLSRNRYELILSNPRKADILVKQVGSRHCRILSSRNFGLPIGVTAVAVKKGRLPKGIPFETGGGTTRLISKDWVLWAGSPGRFEAGTPAIVNVITLASALQLIEKSDVATFAGHGNPIEEGTRPLHLDDFGGLTGKDLLVALRGSLISGRESVPTTKGNRSYIHLDNSASMPAFGPVWDGYRTALRLPETAWADLVEEARSVCSAALGAPEDGYELVFTSNTTEAINLTAQNFGRMEEPGIEPVVAVSLMEHSSNDLPWRMVRNATLIRLETSDAGFVDPATLQSLLVDYNEKHLHGRKRIRMVAVCGASNVTGSCNPLSRIGEMAHRYGSLFMVDAAQLAAHRKIDAAGSGIDFLALSGHKLYAPFGSGIWLARRDLVRFTSGELNAIRSSGEENVAGIAALAMAFLLLGRIGMEVVAQEEAEITAYALCEMSGIPGLRIFGIASPEHPGFQNRLGVITFTVGEQMANVTAGKLAREGALGVRYGCHCSHIAVKHLLGVSPGLERFQRFMLTVIPGIRLPGVTRISFGLQNSREDIHRLIEILGQITKSKRNQNGMTESGVKGDWKRMAGVAARRIFG